MTGHQEEHDFGNPLEYLDAIEVDHLSAAQPPCPHCAADHRLMAGPGTSWLLEVFHQPGCPEHDDNQPTPQRPRPNSQDR